MTLKDTFGRKHDYLRLSLVEKCNLRCQYCMPEQGVQLNSHEKLLTTNEVLKLAKIFVNKFKINKIRLTGGEPLLRKDLISIVRYLNDILRPNGLKTISMTTNATILNRHCKDLKEAGLDAVNISIDSLVPAKNDFITRRFNTFKSVMNGIECALKENFNKIVKLNCVVMKNFNDDEIIDFVEFTKDRFIDVRFIEYMPFNGNDWKNNKLVSYDEMIKIITKHYKKNLIKLFNDGDFFNSTSKPYKIKDYKGQIGFITSMTNNFCSSCNRLRITADGNLKVCLFDNNEISLRDILRRSHKEEELIKVISDTLLKKKAKHPGYCDKNEISKFSHLNETSKFEMVDISCKPVTKRFAKAQSKIYLNEHLFNLVKLNKLAKGECFSVSRLAGIQAAKQTSFLIPLCHQLNLTKIDIKIKLDENNYTVIFESSVEVLGSTGVEMEALTAVSVASLTLYDMCKSVSKDILIKEIKLIYKSGGKSGLYENNFN